MTAIARPALTAIDCPNPHLLAEFYSTITGWPIDAAAGDFDWVALKSDAGMTLAFQLVDDYVAPSWPGQDLPQQAHLDFDVTDLDAAEKKILAIGAVKHEVQPGTSFRVYLDPAGHPFCLCLVDS